MVASMQEISQDNGKQMDICKLAFDSTERFIIALDRDGNISSCNEAAQPVAERLLFAIRSGGAEIEQAVLGKAGRCEIWMDAAEGDIRVLDCRLKPVKDADGELQGVLIEASDVSEYHRSLRALQQGQQWYRALVKHIPHTCVFVYDTNLRYVLADGQGFDDLPYTKEQFEGHTVREALAVTGFAASLANYEAALRGESIRYEFKSSASGRYYAVSHTPLYDFEGSGAIVGGMLLFVGISHLKQKEIELMSKIEQLDQYNYIASHDLQEPLRMIVSYSQLLATRYKSKFDADAQEWLGFLEEGATRMQQMIYDLRILHEIDNSELPASDINVNLVLATICTRQMDIIDRHGIEITADPLPVVKANAQHFRLLLEHLLDNAIKFREPSRTAHIEIHATPKAGKWLFSVCDNGIGIKKEYTNRIFNIFMRLNPRHLYTGSGIGLALCKRIVEHNGGEIWAESEAGQGTTIFFTWPG